ncbi:GNAT family N-acetyltransferase [Vibrio sp. 10N]|uniref:GNAT family N-acetyltransferase n=1 Tax=Vibrio sp. 10N TaxID=3058938 RepID=UPI002814166D|nr:hypothetical protein VB10N_14550 [Vibrio sp. 10N]
MNQERLSFQDITLRVATEQDFEPLYRLMTKDEAWTELNGPYFGYQRPAREQFREGYFSKLMLGNEALVIEYHQRVVGTVSCYWEDKKTRWLEVGVLVYDSRLWGCGIGMKALIPWVSYLFNTLDIERVGLTTWSGNPRMMKCALKLGMTQEARLRKVRYYQGHYYDSVKYGVLREEWRELEKLWRQRDHIYLFDWGDTLMVDDPTQSGKMCDWLKVQPVEGAEALLSGLAKYCPIYVATNAKDSAEQDVKRAFERAQLAEYLSGYFCFSNLGVGKDDDDFYPRIASKLNTDTSQLVMTGDQLERDILPARRAGLRTNWFNASSIAHNENGFARLEDILYREQSRMSLVDLD